VLKLTCTINGAGVVGLKYHITEFCRVVVSEKEQRGVLNFALMPYVLNIRTR